MKKVTLIAMLLVGAISMAQDETTSFEEPKALSGDYTDLGNPNESHDLLNNTGEPFVNFTSNGGELGFNARYEPYDTPGEGLTDGDDVGITNNAPSGDNAFPDGEQGYQISDVDGNFILEFDPIVSTSTSPSMSIDYFISETGYEGDGTVNELGSDRLRIYVKHLEENTEYDILDTTGNDINDLGLEGVWNSGFVNLPPNVSSSNTFQLVIEVRCNLGAEKFFFDDIRFNGLLNTATINSKPFSIYPNPVYGDTLHIISKEPGFIKVEIFNLLGQNVFSTSILNESINISELMPGIYIVKIIMGMVSSTHKIVID